ncbi:Exopolysaccharide synthesis ExoD [Methanobacterium lacus]|uniref:Exopolysaccharide synthesis ExoD n=1 Tax=Methanobacterium lacus (strain AL-21) TaxID=877455 RepID=F0TBF5_METLA|nr:exopolysaccharide biosynthesis protein [Methanobacterium lacus]ADZ10224.1 Exopolysaccharide synthesis ExoD [Methanobacterium lacus]
MSKESTTESTSKIISGVSEQIPEDGVNFREFLDLIGEQGGLISCLILVAPFLLPVSIPGSSLPFGLAIILINIAILTKTHPLIPKMVMEYRISQSTMVSLLNGMNRILKGLEKFVKPRLNIVTRPYMDQINNVFMIFCAFLLMLPLPVPLTDFLPAYSILFLTLGSVENDGYMVIAGYLMALVTAIYFLLIALLGISGIKALLSILGINL